MIYGKKRRKKIYSGLVIMVINHQFGCHGNNAKIETFFKILKIVSNSHILKSICIEDFTNVT